MAIIEGTNGNDKISTTSTVPGQPFATNLADILNGYGGNDSLAGGGGADVMTGGTGNDRYYVDNAGDVVTEEVDEGLDGVFTTLLSYMLGDNVDGLKFIGSGDFTGTGNELANKLYGAAGADTLDAGGGSDLLDGGVGADVMIGGTGNDQYYVDDAGDIVTEEEDEGVDGVFTTLLIYTLGAHLEGLKFVGSGDFFGTGNELANKLYGGSGADTLAAGDGNDLLDGGAGADVMFGGLGDDVYYVNDGGDAVIEGADEGIDTVIASADFALIPGQSIENLRVAGTAGLSLTGNELDNYLLGGIGGDTLNGGEGNDKLAGGRGADLMAGGVGDDVYYVDNASDIVFEELGEGVDTVYASTSYELTAGYEVEILRAKSTGSVSLIGNEFDNTLVGGAGFDFLDGGEGADWLLGAAGDDYLDGGTGADRLEGGAGNDTLVDCDCDFDDILMGGNGSDFLLSGGGADTLSGGNGLDVFVYLAPTDSTHDRRDTILDFKHGVDILDFSMLEGGASFHPLVTVGTAPTTIDAFTLLAFVSGGNTILYVNNTENAQAADAASMEILLQGTKNLTDSDLGYYLM